MPPAVDHHPVAASTDPDVGPRACSAFPLALAQPGERLCIARFRGGCCMAMRLTEMGLNVGSEICVSHRCGGQLIVVRGEARLALGAGISHKVMVTPVGATADARSAA